MSYVDLSKTSWRPNAFVAAQFRKAGALRGLGGCGGYGAAPFVMPPMPPVPVPRNMPQRRMLAAPGGSPASDMLRARDAMINRLRVFPDYREVNESDADTALSEAKEAIDPKRPEIDQYLATMSGTDPVPSSINFTMSREQAQNLILAYMWYGSVGSIIYEDGTADAMVKTGAWDQSFVDGDLKTRKDIFDTLAQWDQEGFIDRAFGATAAAGFGNPWIIGGAVVAAAILLCGTYYLVTTTNFANEVKIRQEYQKRTCDELRAQPPSPANKLAIENCDKALLAAKSVAEEQADAAKFVGGLVVGGLLLYGLIVYGAPHWLDVMDRRGRGQGDAR